MPTNTVKRKQREWKRAEYDFSDVEKRRIKLRISRTFHSYPIPYTYQTRVLCSDRNGNAAFKSDISQMN